MLETDDVPLHNAPPVCTGTWNNLTLHEAPEPLGMATCSPHHSFRSCPLHLAWLCGNPSLGPVVHQPVTNVVSIGCCLGVGRVGGDVAGLQEAASDFIDQRPVRYSLRHAVDGTLSTKKHPQVVPVK